MIWQMLHAKPMTRTRALHIAALRNAKRLALPTVLLLACGPARAAEWVSIGKTDDGKQAFVDISSIRVEGDIRRAWIKGVAVPNTTRGPGKYADRWLSYFLSRDVINCADQTLRTEAVEAHFDDGSTLSAPTKSYPTPWKPVTPESRAAAEMKFICAWKPKWLTRPQVSG